MESNTGSGAFSQTKYDSLLSIVRWPWVHSLGGVKVVVNDGVKISSPPLVLDAADIIVVVALAIPLVVEAGVGLEADMISVCLGAGEAKSSESGTPNIQACWRFFWII